MEEERWIKSVVISNKGIPEIIKVLKEKYPQFDTTGIAEKAREGYIPNPFFLEKSDKEEEKALAGLLHREQALFLLSYIQLVLEKFFKEQVIENVEEIEKFLVVSADALAHAILLLIELPKMKDMALEMAPALSQLVPICVMLKKENIAEEILTLIFALTDKPSAIENKVDLTEAFARGFEEIELINIANELRGISEKIRSEK